MPATLTAIAIGAVLGAWARYGLALAMNGRSWMPWGTFAANAIGGFLIGLALAHLAAKPELSPLWRMFFVTGFLGALTTFSSFSAEVVVLVHDGDLGRALTLAAMHLVASLVLTALGFVVYRSML
ncbi:fluoride efflux transporter CrcB [Casimicrobium huifangae]|uniref:fluoride efflux transporter CrcB n=1 Tax=Casimicrobium huifangae TaxID=2591109 RepID=UPI0012EBBCF3|nr:fluoride efflux transporter CrcB [Casimicrobium huifangae]